MRQSAVWRRRPRSTTSGSRVFIDDFNRCELGENWTAYTGRPDGDKYGKWHRRWFPSTTVLRLHSRRDGDEWQIGGVSELAGDPEVRSLGSPVPRSNQVPTSPTIFCCGHRDEQWPPEIDFAEDVSSGRDGSPASCIGGTEGESEGERTSPVTSLNGTRSVSVGPGVVRYLLDGEVWAISGRPNMSRHAHVDGSADGCGRLRNPRVGQTPVRPPNHGLSHRSTSIGLPCMT